MPAKEEYAAGCGILEWAELDRFGYRPGGRTRPWNRVRVRVGVEYPQLEAVRQVVGVGYTRTESAECAEAGFDRGNPRGHIGDGLASCEAEPRAPSPYIYSGGHDLGADEADRSRDVRPCRELAFYANLRAPASVRPPWHRENHRADSQDSRKRWRERSQRVAMASQPPAMTVAVAA